MLPSRFGVAAVARVNHACSRFYSELTSWSPARPLHVVHANGQRANAAAGRRRHRPARLVSSTPLRRRRRGPGWRRRRRRKRRQPPSSARRGGRRRRERWWHPRGPNRAAAGSRWTRAIRRPARRRRTTRPTSDVTSGRRSLRQRRLVRLRLRGRRRQRRRRPGDGQRRAERGDAPDGPGRAELAHDHLSAVGSRAERAGQRLVRPSDAVHGLGAERRRRPSPRVERSGNRLSIQRARISGSGWTARQRLVILSVVAVRRSVSLVYERRLAALAEHGDDRELPHHRASGVAAHQHRRLLRGDRNAGWDPRHRLSLGDGEGAAGGYPGDDGERRRDLRPGRRRRRRGRQRRDLGSKRSLVKASACRCRSSPVCNASICRAPRAPAITSRRR